jgi:CDP-diglyceride synthetase
VGTVYFSRPYFAFFVFFLIGGIASAEAIRLCRVKSSVGVAYLVLTQSLAVLSLAATLGVGRPLFDPFVRAIEISPLIAVGMTALGYGILLVSPKEKPAGWQSVGMFLWVWGGMFALLQLVGSQNRSAHFILYCFLPVWGGDSLALFVGRKFGKHQLAPLLSPKKTWEGAIGHIIGALIGGFLVASLNKEPILWALIAASIASVFGQAGDLFESWIKRRAEVKDSGSILPGHGGVLDRIDSLLFAAPVVLLVLFLALPLNK